MDSLKSQNKNNVNNKNKKIHVFLLSTYETAYVAPGYFHNFLFPKGLAVRVTDRVINFVNDTKAKLSEKRLHMEEMCNNLNKRSICFISEVDSSNKLVKKIRKNDIIAEISKEYNGFTVNSIKFHTINEYGVFPISVQIGIKYISMFVIIGRNAEHIKSLGETYSEIKK